MSENVAADERRQKAEIPFRESQLDAADQAEDQARKLLPMLTDVNKASHKLSRRNVLRDAEECLPMALHRASTFEMAACRVGFFGARCKIMY